MYTGAAAHTRLPSSFDHDLEFSSCGLLPMLDTYYNIASIFRQKTGNPMSSEKLQLLATEQVNSENQDLDLWTPFEIVSRMNAENIQIIGAIQSQLPQIAEAVELIVDH